nr:hypothetical protein [Candidatus Woesearchaeota archaeon]
MRWERFFKRHKAIIITTGVILGIIVIFFGAQIILFLNFIIGNDVVVRLDADKEYFSLIHNQEDQVDFEASVITNPFCKAICRYDYYDISDNVLVDSDEFTLKPTDPLEKSYKIKADKPGKGQDIYRFDMECISKRTILCRTWGEPSTRSILINVDYDFDNEEQSLNENMLNQMSLFLESLNDLIERKQRVDAIILKLTPYVNMDREISDAGVINGDLTSNQGRFNRTLSFLFKYDYINSEAELNTLQVEIDKTYSEIDLLENRLDEMLIQYNNLISNLTLNHEELLFIRNNYYGNASLRPAISDAIDVFNFNAKIFLKRTELSTKETVIVLIMDKINSLIKATSNSEKITSEAYPMIEEVNINPVVINELPVNKININLTNQLPQCCVYGECKPCCVNEECFDNPDKYPVIFLHGHAFSRDVSAEYSLEAFNKIQQRLEDDGYLNAGAVTLYTKTDARYGYLSYANVPVTLKTSYYFDVFHEPENYVIVQTKSENIDTYAIRLKELVDVIKYKTGKPKVKIIAFSMGGLVARRYVQIFGTNDVETMILIGTPNNGIYNSINSYCPIIGENLECRDMNANSLFINKLNRDIADVKIHNIIGTGCQMDLSKGDGIVLEENAYLRNATNYYINGTCTRLDPLHLNLLNINLYPEVYNIISDALKD